MGLCGRLVWSRRAPTTTITNEIFDDVDIKDAMRDERDNDKVLRYKAGPNVRGECSVM